ncbi:hypothetical protein EGM70_07930 [Enterobacteriaceae bacterium 89]|nr:hypothetical protein [Enterobacteriaceae bacterium 89]
MGVPCYEIVTYKVRDQEKAESSRSEARSLLEQFPGFIDWIAFSGMGSSGERADLLIWRSLEEARVAAQAVEVLPEFLSFRTSVSSLHSMGHFLADVDATLSPTKSGCGIEMGRFRLRPGVEEGQMREVYQRMVTNCLANLPGWKKQHLVSLENGVYVDLVFAETQQSARAICDSWKEYAECDAFLKLIEAERIEFGSVC